MVWREVFGVEGSVWCGGYSVWCVGKCAVCREVCSV